jgi:hypothetical protein
MRVTYCHLKPIVKGSDPYHEMRWNVEILIPVKPDDLAAIIDRPKHSVRGASEGDIDGGKGILGILGRDKSTEQDTQGQHSRQ